MARTGETAYGLTVKLTGEAERSERRGRRPPWLPGTKSKTVYTVASSACSAMLYAVWTLRSHQIA